MFRYKISVFMGMLQDSDDGKKPLFAQYVKTQKKAGIPLDEISDKVEVIRLSSSEEWILIECDNSVALINAESKVGKAFWEQIQQFEGKLKGLKIIYAKGKLGFDIEPDDSITVDWVWDEDKLSCVEGKSGSVGFSQKLTLSNMQPNLSDESNGTGLSQLLPSRSKKGK